MTIDDAMIKYPDLVRSICLFSAAHTTMHRMNTFSIVSSHSGNARVMYSSNPADMNWKTALISEMLASVDAPALQSTSNGSLAQALSLALCG